MVVVVLLFVWLINYPLAIEHIAMNNPRGQGCGVSRHLGRAPDDENTRRWVGGKRGWDS